MSEKLKFVIKFIFFVTIIFAIFFAFGYRQYFNLLCNIVRELYEPEVPAGAAQAASDQSALSIPGRFFNLATFLSLMLATPRIKLFNRFKLIGLGLLVIFCVHVLLSVIGHAYGYERPSFFTRYVTFYVSAVGQIAFPFLVWLVLAHTYVVPVFSSTSVEGPRPDADHRCPICGRRKKGLVDHIKTVHGHEEGVEEILKRYAESSRNTHRA